MPKVNRVAYLIGAGLTDEAKSSILEALRGADGNRDIAAERLGTSLRTLYRWIQELRMYEDIDKAYAAWGFERFNGPPRKYTAL